MKKKYYTSPSCEVDYFKTQNSILTVSENPGNDFGPFNTDNQAYYSEF